MRSALSIAGSDPSGGAGLQADLQVFRSLGVHGAGVVTALTVQDSKRVHQVLPVFPSVVLDQLRVLLQDITPSAVKVGMLASDDVLRSVAHGLSVLPAKVPVVIDPVIRSSDGTALLERRAWGGLMDLIRGVALVTPNLAEAQALTDCDVSTPSGCEEAARFFIEELGAEAALIKGGHSDGPPDDLLSTSSADGISSEWLSGDRIDAGEVHGTGCALSAAVAAHLAHGLELREAVERARAFVQDGLRNAQAFGAGARFMVPS